MTQLLQELIQISDERYIMENIDMMIMETLGKLNLIDKKFLRLLRKKEWIYSSRAGKSVQKEILSDVLGQESDVMTHEEDNPVVAFKRFTDDKEVIAQVYKIGDVQLFAIAKAGFYKTKSYGPGVPQYGFIIHHDFFKKYVTEDDFKKVFGAAGKKIEFNDYEIRQVAEKVSETIHVGKIKKIITLMFKKAKEAGEKVTSMTVGVDKVRAKKTNDRATNRKDLPPVESGNRVGVGSGKYATFPELHKKWKDQAKWAFRDKLDRFKASKAKGVEDPADLMKFIMDEGYLDKFKMGVFTYEIYHDSIRFRDLKNGAKSGHDQSYIEYKLQKNTPEYDKARERANALYKEVMSGLNADASEEEKHNAYEKYRERRGKEIAPSSIKIILGMKGGAIVPVDIKNGDDYLW